MIFVWFFWILLAKTVPICIATNSILGMSPSLCYCISMTMIFPSQLSILYTLSTSVFRCCCFNPLSSCWAFSNSSVNDNHSVTSSPLSHQQICISRLDSLCVRWFHANTARLSLHISFRIVLTMVWTDRDVFSWHYNTSTQYQLIIIMMSFSFVLIWSRKIQISLAKSSVYWKSK